MACQLDSNKDDFKPAFTSQSEHNILSLTKPKTTLHLFSPHQQVCFLTQMGRVVDSLANF